MNKFLSVIVLLIPFTLCADQEYQIKNIIGDWYTMDDHIFKHYGLRITQEDSSIRLQYCDLRKLQYNGECQKILKIDGTITYSEPNDSLLVNEGSSSPTPSYMVKVDEKKTDRFLRNWGTQKILYFRIK